MLVTFSVVEGHFRLQAFSSAIRRTFVQHFTILQLTALHEQLSPYGRG